MSVQQQSIQPFTMTEYEQLTKKFGDSAVRIILHFIAWFYFFVYFFLWFSVCHQ